MDILKSILSVVAPSLATLVGGPLGGLVVSFLGTKLLGNNAASVTEIISALQDPANLVKLKELDVEMARMESNERIAQIEVNKIDAASGNFYQYGARPGFLWIGVLGFAWAVLIAPLLITFGINAYMPDMDVLMPTVMGLLGIAGMRSFDKYKKTNKK